MNQEQLNELNQLLLKIELVLVDGRRFLQSEQAKFQAEQKKQAEPTKKVAENVSKEAGMKEAK